MNEETKAVIDEVGKRLGGLRSVFSPIIPDALATLEGWTWVLESTPERRIINRGDEIDIFPIIQRSKTGERGWINQLAIVFSDPDTEMIYTTDNWTFRTTPRLLNVFGATLPNNTTVFNPVFNPASPVGPIFSVVWTASQFWPYKTQITFRARHPSDALTPTSQIIFATLGRHYISDEKLFYESIFIEAQKQTLGRVQIPLRRPM